MQLQGELEAFEAAGAQIVAIANDEAEGLRAFQEKDGITFPILVDEGAAVIRSYSVINIERGTIPHPAVVIVDEAGIIRYRHVDPNYKKRPAPTELLEIINAL